MIDTIKCYSEYKENVFNTLMVQNICLNPVDNQETYKFFYNDDKINIDLKPKLGQWYLTIHFSAPKLAGHSDNFYTASKNQIYICESEIQKYLDNLKIKTSVDSLKVNRLDITKNIYLDNEFIEYEPVFKMLSLSRTNKRNYPDGYLISNKQREICIYNKTKELDNTHYSGYSEQVLKLQSNRWARFELRLFKNKQIQKKTNIIKLIDIPEYYELLKPVFIDYTGKLFELNIKSEVVYMELKHSRTLLIRRIMRGDKQAVEKYGLAPLVDLDRKTRVELLKKVYDDRKAYYLNDKVEKLKSEITSEASKTDIKEKYNELKKKITGA